MITIKTVDEFKYYIPYLIIEPDGRHGAGFSFIARPAPIETEDDLKEIRANLEQKGSLASRSIIILDWKRLQ